MDTKSQPLPERISPLVADRRGRKIARTNRALTGKGILVNPGEDIQRAIDAVEKDGGGVVTLVGGTHNADYSIDIPSFITLKGEGRDNTIIDFGSGNYQITLTGTAGGGNANDPAHNRNVRIQVKF